MRCRSHPSDPGVGVCACCLRERLSALISSHGDANLPMKSQKPDPSAPPPAIHCSASTFSNNPDHRSRDNGRKRCAVRFSLLSPFFGYPSSGKSESNAGGMKPSLSSSWYLALDIRQWRKKKKKSPEFTPPVNRRGMSPVSRDPTDEDNRHLSTPPPLRRNAQRQQSPSRLSSYALCMNPMLRPISGNRQNHCPSMTFFPDDIRRTFDHRWSSVGVAFTDPSSVLASNRSRKLVDLGKTW